MFVVLIVFIYRLSLLFFRVSQLNTNSKPFSPPPSCPSSSSDGEGGETLTVADGNEVWVFSVSPDDTGKSAIFTAQKVPAGHLTVITNSFNIGVIDFTDTDNFITSTNILEVAERIGMFDPKTEKTVDFTKVFRSPKGKCNGLTWLDQFY